MAELQYVPVIETGKRGLSALAPLVGVSPSGLTSGGWEDGQTYCPGEHPGGTARVRPQKSARMGRRIC